MKYKEQLIDEMFPFIDELLEKHGEFYPLAAAIKSDGVVASVATYDGNDKPLSDDVIESLKQALKEGYQKGEYIAGVIFFDVRVTDPDTGDKKDAVAVLYESAEEPEATRFYYPYLLKDQRQPTFDRGWYNDVEKEIFIKH